MEIWIVDFCFYAEDCCDDVVILICDFPCGNVALRLLFLICCLLNLALVVLLGAYAPLDSRVLATWCTGMFALLRVLLWVSSV
jgi:hypothetical protein